MFVRDKSLMPVIDLFLRLHAVNLGFFSKYQIRFLAQSTQCNIGRFVSLLQIRRMEMDALS